MWVLQRAGFLARGVEEKWKLCWPMVVVLYLPKWGEPYCRFHAVGMQTPMSKEGDGEAVGELPAPSSIWKPVVLTGLQLPAAGWHEGVVACAWPGPVLRGRAAGAVGTEAVGNISGEVSYWAPALGFTGL